MRYSNESKTKSNGVVYTPTDMANYLASKMIQYRPLKQKKTIDILDPAVGEGELLVAMLSLVKKHCSKIRVVGYETDEAVGNSTKEKLQHLFPDIEIDIRIADFIKAVEHGKVEAFDYIIANPPYIRTQIMGSNKSQDISEKLQLSGRVDIYYAFLLYTKHVLKKDGIAGYITSNKFMTIKAGNSVRNYMIQNYKIHHITDLGDTKLFNAAVLPCIMIFSLGKTIEKNSVNFTSVYQSQNVPDANQINCIFDKIDTKGVYQIPDGRCYQYQQGTINSTEQNMLWTISSDENSRWLANVEKSTWMYFSQIGRIRVGIKTTADNVFIGEDWTGEKSNIELLKPLITHRNAGQIIPNTESQWKVLYPHGMKNGSKFVYDINDYPNSKAYLEKFYDQLAGREYLKKAKRNWYEIWVPQNPDSWQHKKIVFRDISEKPEFWYDESGAIVNGDCYWIDIFPNTMDSIVYLALAIANSKFIEKYYDIKFNTKLYSGKRRYQAQYVEQFPIPFYCSDLSRRAISLVKTIISHKNNLNIQTYKEELDTIVEQLFA